MTATPNEKPIPNSGTFDLTTFAKNLSDQGIVFGSSNSYKFNTGKLINDSMKGSYQTGSDTPYAAGGPEIVGPDSPITQGMFGEDVPAGVKWGDYDEWLNATFPKQGSVLKKTLKQAGYSSWSAALKGASFNPNVPVANFITARAEQNIGDASGSGSRNGPYATTSTSVALSSESQAAATLDQMYQQELGRTADDKEIAAFKKALNAAQMQAPSKTVTKGVTAGRNSTTQSVTDGGFDPTRFARQYAQSQEGFGERYAGITFMDALDKAISSPDSLDQMAGNL
jgi:hypothetical protein